MQSSEKHLISNIYSFSLSLLGAIFNALVLLCIQRNPLRCFRNSSSYLVANQSFADMVKSLFIACFYCALFHDLSAKEIFPTIIRIFVVLSVISFAALFLVSLDRFFAIRFPIRYRIHVKPRLVAALIASIWLSALIIIVLTVLKPSTYHTLRRFLVIVGGALVLIKLCLHRLAFWTMKSKRKGIQRSGSQSSTSSKNQQLVTLKREKRFLFTIFLLTVVVLVTTIPFLGAYCVDRSIGIVWSEQGMLMVTIQWMGVIACPCIYFIRLNNYQNSLKKLLCL